MFCGGGRSIERVGRGELTIEPATGHRLLVHGDVDAISVELLAERVSAEAGEGESGGVDCRHCG